MVIHAAAWNVFRGETLQRFGFALATVVLGIVIGLGVVELGLAVFGPGGVHDATGGPQRMHYIYTNTGLGKCYPSDSREYFPHDLTDPEQLAAMRELIADVSDLPDELSPAEKVDHLRDNAPSCNNIELVALNTGPNPERPHSTLVIGDSFAFGEGLRIEDSIGYSLARRFPASNFVNMAWPGASLETLYDVSKHIDRYKAVLYLYNINDLYRTAKLDQRSYELHSVNREQEVAEPLENSGRLFGYCGYFRACQLLERRDAEIHRSQASIDFYHDLYFSDENDEPRERSFAKIAAMKADIERQGARFVVVMFPLFYKAPLADYPLGRIHDYVRERVEGLGIEFIDLLPAYDGYMTWDDLTVHPLDRHPSAKAVDVAAEYLSSRLQLE